MAERAVDVIDDLDSMLDQFNALLSQTLEEAAATDNVAGFKSIACYRTGLNISLSSESDEIKESIRQVYYMLRGSGKLRISHKPLNDHVVRTTLQIAGKHRKPGSIVVCQLFVELEN
jgi:hypothetical protein